MTSPLQTNYDVVIVGGGHNGLVAASYLSKAGLRVLVLERRAALGGAAISERAFPGVDVRLSAYAYLVSLFPQKIMQDLGLNIETRRRRIASFTPSADGKTGLLISNQSAAATRDSFVDFTETADEYNAFQEFYGLTGVFAKRVWPTLLSPLQSRAELLKQFDSASSRLAWDWFVERPLGEAIEANFKNDLVRGTVFTDGKIGALTTAHDPSLLQNRTFLYHVIGNATGEWRVPVGGMGALTSALADVAQKAGAELLTNCSVTHVHNGPTNEIEFIMDEQPRKVSARFVLVNATPNIFADLTGTPAPTKPNGAVFKINMVLTRLPRLLAENVTAKDAFCGTFHFNEGYAAMQASYAQAAAGKMPDVPPGEMYCHSLTDHSILGETAKSLYTLTLFGLDMPYSLFEADNTTVKAEALRRYLAGINSVLGEPIENCLTIDAYGNQCIAAKSPVDLEHELAMTGGNIFHRDLAWPFAEREEEIGTWGVETQFPNIFICGAGAKRGGGVSGIAGHNAAQKVLSVIRSS